MQSYMAYLALFYFRSASPLLTYAMHTYRGEVVWKERLPQMETAGFWALWGRYKKLSNEPSSAELFLLSKGKFSCARLLQSHFPRNT
jgi:hypothetical protein